MASTGWCWALVVALAIIFPATEAYRVLGFFPFNGRSHNLMFKATMEVLAERGHEVVMVSPFPQKTPRANYTDVDLSKQFPSLAGGLTYEQVTNYPRSAIIKIIADISGADFCRAVFETKEFRDIMNGAYGKFDVVFTEIFGSDCWAIVPYKLNTPLISIVTTPEFSHQHARVGSVDNPSYLIVNNEPMTGRMDFLQRVRNTYAYLASNFLVEYLIQRPSDAVLRDVFGEDTPPISELVKRTSLVMVNRHESVNPARPIPPNVIHVGGIHLRNLRPDRAGVDADLLRWMDGAEHGVIYFTLGSFTRVDSLPKAAIDALLGAFAALPHRVLWKYETDGITDLVSDNVRIAKWMPQVDILAHPKTVLFITHGGLMGTTEAIMLGVPMLGIPLYADQAPNVELYRELGIAERLDHTDITKENLLAKINQLTGTDAYRVRAKEVAARHRDRPMSAADSAVWWTEYVIRHRGATHLRPLGADMPLHQYLLLDVAALALGTVIGGLLLLRALLRRVLAAATKVTAGTLDSKKTL